MEDVGIFYDHLVYLKVIWYFLWPFGIFVWSFGMFSAVLVCRNEKNLATLAGTALSEQ
jgi:hypothetical protein